MRATTYFLLVGTDHRQELNPGMPVISMRVLKVGITVTSLILQSSLKCMVINRSKIKMRRQLFVPLCCLTDHNSRSVIISREVKLSFYGRRQSVVIFFSSNRENFFPPTLLCSFTYCSVAKKCSRCRNLTNWRQFFSVCNSKIISWHRQSFVDPRTQQFYSNERNLSSITNPARSLAAGDTHGNFIAIKFDT